MFFYYAYGLGIQSQIALPGFLPAASGDDVVVWLKAPAAATENSGGQWSYTITDGCITMAHSSVGRIQISDGREIVIIPVPSADMQLLPFYIAGTAMAWVLWQQGTLPLHGASVAIDGRAAVFLGNSGQGKSTTVAAMHARGHAILVDDVTPVTIENELAVVHPGFPMLKLSPETLPRLGLDPTLLRPLHPRLQECGYLNPRGFPCAPLPLGAVFVMVDSEEFREERLEPREALFELMRGIYGARQMQPHFGVSRFFRECSSIAASVPFYRLHRVRSFAQLPELARRVEECVCKAASLLSLPPSAL